MCTVCPAPQVLLQPPLLNLQYLDGLGGYVPLAHLPVALLLHTEKASASAERVRRGCLGHAGGGAGSVRAHLQGKHALLELRVVPAKILCRDPGGDVLAGSPRRGLHAIVQQRARRALLRQVLQRLVHEWTNLLLAHRLPKPVLHLRLLAQPRGLQPWAALRLIRTGQWHQRPLPLPAEDSLGHLLEAIAVAVLCRRGGRRCQPEVASVRGVQQAAPCVS